MWKYPVIVQIGKAKHSATFGDMMAIPATKNLWARINSFTALMNTVNGLFEDIDHLLHPTLISADHVHAIFRALLNVYSQKMGTLAPTICQTSF